MTPDAPDERRVTTDPDRIRGWAEHRDAVPARLRSADAADRDTDVDAVDADADVDAVDADVDADAADADVDGDAETKAPDRLTFVRRADLEDVHEPLSWDSFVETLEEAGLVFAYDADAPDGRQAPETARELGYFALVDRKRAAAGTDLDREAFETALDRGETVTSELAESPVVERGIVEREAIESEILDRERLERAVLDAEPIDRELAEVEFVDGDPEHLSVLVDEQRRESVAVVERLTVESRVLDADRVDRADGVRSDLDIDAVQRTILESDVVGPDVDPDAAVDRGAIRSRRTGGDAVETDVVERRTVDETVAERRRLEYRLADARTVEDEVVGSETLDEALLDVEEYGSGTTDGLGGEQVTGDERGTGDGYGTIGTAGGPADGSTAAESPVGPAVPESQIDLTTDEHGKTVVDQSGETVGVVTSVGENVAIVDPEPGLADRLAARFGWGSDDEDSYRIEAAQVAEVTDEDVVLRGE